jgi:putative membrane protein
MTTASNAKAVPFRHNRLLHLLCGIFLVVFAVSAWRPVMAEDWWLENGLVFLFVGGLIATYRWMPLSDLSYVLICCYLALHEWGAHHMYANVPAGEWIKQAFHTLRNDYDRVVHFAFGLLLSYPQREILVRRLRMNSAWASWITVWLMLGYGAMYEEIEAIAAVTLSPDAGDAFLGLQGDPWDTHKDMFMGFLGAAIAMGITAVLVRRRTARKQKIRIPLTVGTGRNH